MDMDKKRTHTKKNGGWEFGEENGGGGVGVQVHFVCVEETATWVFLPFASPPLYWFASSSLSFGMIQSLTLKSQVPPFFFPFMHLL